MMREIMGSMYPGKASRNHAILLPQRSTINTSNPKG